MRHACLALAAALALAACQVTEPAVNASAFRAQPSSALAGAVRALETVGALSAPDTPIEVRAHQCETRVDSERRRTVERVFLDLTIYAPSQGAAQDVFRAVAAALRTEARASERVEPANPERVRLALARLDEVAAREDFVSYSDRVALEVQPGASSGGGTESATLQEGLETYVRSRAARAESVGGVRLRPADERAVAVFAGTTRFELTPAFEFQRFELFRIASFLASLEADSPGVRLTRLSIERSQHEPDIHSPRRWTFSAELACPESNDFGAGA